jgi:hypothetical protein
MQRPRSAIISAQSNVAHLIALHHADNSSTTLCGFKLPSGSGWRGQAARLCENCRKEFEYLATEVARLGAGQPVP